jgi:nickel/cobalt exporter
MSAGNGRQGDIGAMTPLSDLMQQGGSASWLFIPTAIVLGALHGLEPGHSKTMMAAFIIAVRGTVGQAVLLGVAATLSHTAVVWAVALGGMYLFSGFDAEATEPYFQVVSALLIIAIAGWMVLRTWREQQEMHAARVIGEREAAARPAMRRIDTGHGHVGLELRRDDGTGAARWHLATLTGQPWDAADVTVATTAGDGRRKVFAMAVDGDHLASVDSVQEPHVFTATLTLNHDDHEHDYDVEFTGEEQAAMDAAGAEPMDAHSRAHANDIRKRFTNRQVTTGQIVMFGLTGGLIPCPAAITVLLLCLQVKQLVLGSALVAAFSVGLALTMVTAGVAASLSVKHLSKHFAGFGGIAARAPYVSSAVIICMGLYLGFEGLRALSASGAI